MKRQCATNSTSALSLRRAVALAEDGEAELEKEPDAVAGNSSLVEVVSDAAEGDLAAFGSSGRLLPSC